MRNDLEDLAQIVDDHGVVRAYDKDGNLRVYASRELYPYEELHYDEDGNLVYVEFEGVVPDSDTVGEAIALWEKSQESRLDVDVFVSAWHLDIPADEVEEKYMGEYHSDGEFAEQYAIDTGAVGTDESWPYDHIDWESAADEIMTHNFTEWDEHYFLR